MISLFPRSLPFACRVRGIYEKIDMTHGPIGRKTIRFALLLALTGMLQQVFNTIDTIIMGQFVGKEAMAAVGSNTPIIGFIVTFFIGISIGANVVISQMTGKKNREGIHRAVFSTLAFALAAGIVMTCLSEAVAEPLLSLLQVPDALMPLSAEYLRIFFLALPGILVYNFASAIFRSQGDTKTPLFCLAAAGVIKVIISYTLVAFFHQGVAAVAISTTCATLLSSAMLVTILLRSTHVIHLECRASFFDLYILREILRIGTPAGLQAAVFCLSNIVIQSAINSLGADVMAATAAAFNLDILCYIFVNAFGQACTTFVGQNYGAGDMARCRRVGVITTLQNLVVCVIIGAPILYFRHRCLRFYQRCDGHQLWRHSHGLYHSGGAFESGHRNDLRLSPRLWQFTFSGAHHDRWDLRLPHPVHGDRISCHPQL